MKTLLFLICGVALKISSLAAMIIFMLDAHQMHWQLLNLINFCPQRLNNSYSGCAVSWVFLSVVIIDVAL